MRSALIWSNPWSPDGKLLIEALPLASIDLYRQDHASKPEAGGIFLGYRRGGHLHITVATVPQPSDQRKRYWFKRSTNHHQQVALQHWKASGQMMDYLGEWHTHPEQHPAPSQLDLSEWRKICEVRPHPMVFAILGWGGELWLGVSEGRAVERCTLTGCGPLD
jgi:integrative and conjugative element protein (TIGR02256 family)